MGYDLKIKNGGIFRMSLSMSMNDQDVSKIVARVLGEMQRNSTVSSEKSMASSDFYKDFVPNEVLGEGGCEPFDTDYGLMDTSVLSDLGPSPYPRVNRILKRVHEIEETVDDERAMLYTEAHKKLGAGGSVILKNARILQHILENMTIDIYPDELIVGEMGAPARFSPIFPEFSYDWIVDELHNSPWANRESDRFACSEETKRNLLSIAEYWEGQNLKDQLEQFLSEDILNGSSLGTAAPVHFPNLYMYGGVGHYTMDFAEILREGLKGVKCRVAQCLTGMGENTIDTKEGLEKREFYTAALVALESGSMWIRRYAKLAKEMANAEKDVERKKELLFIAENCEWVSENPPRTLWEAMQLMNFVVELVLIESNGHSISYGRFDMILNPYYEKDMKEGQILKSFASQLIECFYIKIFELRKLRDEQTATLNSEVGIGGSCLLCGGVNEKGEDATNDMTYLCIEAYNHTRLTDPWFAARWFEDAPWEYKVKLVESIKIGTGQPKLFNDAGVIPTLIANGLTVEEARDYTVVGCVEVEVGGKTYGAHDADYFNMARVLEFAINNGKTIEGEQVSIDTGSIADFKTIDEVKISFEKQMKYWVDRMAAFMNATEIMQARCKPIPFASCMIQDCIRKGKDLTLGGAKYNFAGPQGVGIASVADGLSTIEQLVFDEKRTNGNDLLNALRNNWEGYEELYRYINSDHVHHYGNDDDYADQYATYAADVYCNEVSSHDCTRGGKMIPGIYSVSGNVGIGLTQGASIDGRKAQEALSNSLGPVHNCIGCHDITGPTAMGNSANKIDHQKAGNGTLMNVRFSPACVSGANGTENFINYIDGYFHKGAQHCQFNIANTEMLKDAQKHPEKYPGLLVRVAGYSAYFVRMTKALQDDLIGRNSYDSFN